MLDVCAASQLSNHRILIAIPLLINAKTGPRARFTFIGGEGGIRTLDAFRHTHFPGVLLRPLGHLTVVLF